jgi:hypothetical protein
MNLLNPYTRLYYKLFQSYELLQIISYWYDIALVQSVSGKFLI